MEKPTTTADAKLLADEIEQNREGLYIAGSSLTGGRMLDADEEALILKALRSERYVHAPAGWKLVPVEPTYQMLEASRLLDSFPFGDDRVKFLHDQARKAWSAMLNASPLISLGEDSK